MKHAILVLLTLTPAFSWAAPGHGGEHGLDEKTLKTMIYQAINVGILVFAMIYFLKDMVRQYFKDKQAAYVGAAEKAQSALKQAEQEYQQVKIQLTKLESTADESLSRARADAADLRNQMANEAQQFSKKVQEEAKTAAKLEVEKARTQLRDQMIREAVQQAEQTIRSKVSREDHQRLQGDFIQKIEAVQS